MIVSLFVIKISLFLFLLNKNVFCETESENINEVINFWKNFDKNLNIDLDYLTSGFASNFESIANEANISNECYENFRQILVDAKSKKANAVQVLGAWGKLPTTGIIDGTVSDFGHFDTCINMDEIDTHYCTVELRFLLPKRKRCQSFTVPINELVEEFRDKKKYLISKLAKIAHFTYYSRAAFTGICLPVSCTADDVSKAIRVVGNRLGLIGQLSECVNNKSSKFELDIYQVLSILFFSSLILLAIIGTSIDYFNIFSHERKFRQYLLAFSVKRNFNSLFKINESSDELKCLNGLRVLTSLWVIFAHTIRFFNKNILQSLFNVIDITTEFKFLSIFNSHFSVETFFVVSGLLTSYIEIKKGDGKKLNFINHTLSRYLRLFPGLLAAMASSYILLLIGNGPIFNETMKPFVQPCYTHWWVNLFFAQNYMNMTDICLGTSWYLAVDYQLSIIAFFVILFFYRKAMFSVIYMVIIFLISILVTVYSYFNTELPPDFMPTIVLHDELFYEYMAKVYVRPFIHTGSYLIGLSLGILIAKRKLIKNKNVYMIGWMIGLIALFGSLQSNYFWNIGMPWSNFSATIYACTARTVFGLGVAWIIYACFAGFGGPIGAFLCWDGFVIPARLTYMTYLMHTWVFLYCVATRKTLIYADISSFIFIYLSTVLVSYLVGFLFTILCERPFFLVGKLWFTKRKSD